MAVGAYYSLSLSLYVYIYTYRYTYTYKYTYIERANERPLSFPQACVSMTGKGSAAAHFGMRFYGTLLRGARDLASTSTQEYVKHVPFGLFLEDLADLVLNYFWVYK